MPHTHPLFQSCLYSLSTILLTVQPLVCFSSPSERRDGMYRYSMPAALLAWCIIEVECEQHVSTRHYFECIQKLANTKAEIYTSLFVGPWGTDLLLVDPSVGTSQSVASSRPPSSPHLAGPIEGIVDEARRAHLAARPRLFLFLLYTFQHLHLVYTLAASPIEAPHLASPQLIISIHQLPHPSRVLAFAVGTALQLGKPPKRHTATSPPSLH